MRSSASRVMPRMPQWMSEKWLEYTRLRIHVVSGVPTYWWSHGMAPSSMEPFQREPITNSSPLRNASTKGPSCRKS